MHSRSERFPSEATDCLLSLLPKPGKSSRVVVGRAICVRLAFRIHVAKCWLMCLRLGFCKMLEPILTLGLSKHTGRGKL